MGSATLLKNQIRKIAHDLVFHKGHPTKRHSADERERERDRERELKGGGGVTWQLGRSIISLRLRFVAAFGEGICRLGSKRAFTDQ